MKLLIIHLQVDVWRTYMAWYTKNMIYVEEWITFANVMILFAFANSFYLILMKTVSLGINQVSRQMWIYFSEGLKSVLNYPLIHGSYIEEKNYFILERCYFSCSAELLLFKLTKLYCFRTLSFKRSSILIILILAKSVSSLSAPGFYSTASLGQVCIQGWVEPSIVL